MEPPCGVLADSMQRFSLSDFQKERARFDEAVAKSPGLARFCSSSLWQAAALETIRPPGPRDEYVIVEDERGNWLVFAEREGNRIFFPFEAAWMFGGLSMMRRSTKCSRREYGC